MEKFDGTTILDPNRFAYSSPGGPHQCYDYPITVYHATEPPRTVHSREQLEALGEGWSKEYIKRDYPKAKFNQETGEFRSVKDPEEEGKLEGSWGDTPPERATRPGASKDKTLQEVMEAARDYRRLSLDYQQLNQALDTKVDNEPMKPIQSAEAPYPQFHPEPPSYQQEKKENGEKKKR